jgi:hypothetical protein
MGKGRPAYHRTSTRTAPHNAYTSSEDLLPVAVSLGAAPTISAGLHLRPFRDDSPATARGTDQTIEIPYNTVTVRYSYDAETNAYKRSLNGKAHVDPMDDERVTARTVVVLFMSFRTDGSIEKGHARPVLGFVGSGKALVYSEGRMVEGTWSKASETSPTLVLGPDGAEVPFIRGRIFLQVVPLKTRISS